jgi:hypothetical protein
MKRKIFVFSLSFFLLFIISLNSSFAQNNVATCQIEEGKYKLLEGIPGVAGACTEIKFPEYISKVYIFAMSAIAVASLLMITIGAGYWLLSAGNASVAGTGKTIIKDALIGLAVAFLSYLLLYTLNPDILSGRLDVESLRVDSSANNSSATNTNNSQ